MSGSGDFSRQASEPQPFKIKKIIKEAAQGALSDAQMVGLDWDTLPYDLARGGIDITIKSLIKFGHRDMTVLELAVRMGICHMDGSWT